MTGFTEFNSPPSESNQINYRVDTTRAKFFTFIPDNYTGKENFGLIVYTSPQDSITDYWRAVRKVAATSDTDTLGNPYGIADISKNEIARAKSTVRFALITGPDDFRRGNIVDIYNDGYARDGFQARLFDIPGMGHQDCSGETLEKILNYLDTGR